MVPLSTTRRSDEAPQSARCQHYGLCGGCRTQRVPYDLQVRDKQTALRHLLRPVLTEDLLSSLDVHPSPVVWEYRNRMEFTFSSHEDRVVLGLHRRGRYWDVLDLEECWLCPPAFVDLVREVRHFASQSGLPAYDKSEHTGFWRYLLVRGSRATGQILADVMTAIEDAQAIDALADHLRRASPKLAGLFWSRVPGMADAAIPDHTDHLFGEQFVIERLVGLEIPVGPRTFMQPNVAVAEILYEHLADALHSQGTETLLDLYCGVGTIGASLAGGVGKVYGVEKEPENTEMGQEMIRRNGLGNMRIVAADVESLRSKLTPFDRPDVVVVDPPRAGLTKKVLRYLHSCNPHRIAYVSCNPKALKENLQRFSQTGVYYPKLISAYDMFPHTPHVEVLCVLDRVR